MRKQADIVFFHDTPSVCATARRAFVTPSAVLTTRGACKADQSLLLRGDEVGNRRHTGEGRYPVSDSKRGLARRPHSGLPTGRFPRSDDFNHLRAWLKWSLS